MTIDAQRINGNIYSWSSVEAFVGDDVITGITDVSYGETRTREKAYGTANHRGPRGRTKGKYEVEDPTMTLHLDSWRALTESLAQLAPDGISYGDVPFVVVVQYVEPGEVPISDVLEDCVIVGWTKNPTEGADAATVEVTLSCMKIRSNGKTLAGSEVL